MSEVARHYEQLLGRHYVWMSGLPFADKVAEEQALLRHLGLAPGAYGTAIDLGCGPGFQSIALARLGFARVLAVDTSEALLDELNTHKGGLPVDTIRTDLRRLVHVRLADGWRLTKSSYRKLRLAPGELVAELQGLGFKVQRSEPAGRLHAIVARR